jgi:NAD-dependent dihydropyrimidine dehydrogenase PreA subunit
MEVKDRQIYERFIEWLRKPWWEMPDSGVLMPLIRARYTPEEALLLTGIPFSGKTVEELAGFKKMDPEELAPVLEAMTIKGLVYKRVKGERVLYNLNDSFFVFLRSAFWHGKSDENTKTMAALVNQYFYNGFFEQYGDAHAKGLRTLPIRETIDDTRAILPYEDVIGVLDNPSYFAVSVCPCRHRKNIDDDSADCTYPAEVCLHFDDLGRYTVESGLGRKITREEARQILRQSAEAGLVHGVSNWKEKVDTICNCCKCCCMWFEAYHKLGHSRSLDESNYRVKTSPETCKACGLCVKRCPMEALTLEDSSEAGNKKGKAALVNPDLCIGCGVCAFKCPTKSLVLERREVTVDPPENMREYGHRYLADRIGAKAGE